jgi:hypothetical protein
MQRYVEFVLDAYERLNLPYPFTASLAYMVSPVLMREDIFLAFDEDHQVVGCLSYIRGTAEYDYSNREVVQLQVLFIEPPYRCSTMLLSFMQMLVQCLNYRGESVTELQFWSKADHYIRNLIARRFVHSPEIKYTAHGSMEFYTIPFQFLASYVNKFPQVQYF